MRAGYRAVGFGKFSEQPLHLVLIEWHIDLDRCVAGNRRSNTGAKLLQIDRLLLARDLVDQFMQEMLNLVRLYASGSELHHDAARAKRLCLKAVLGKFLGNFREHRLLRRRKLEHQRHQQTLTLHPLSRALLEKYLE